jgi:trigger factor
MKVKKSETSDGKIELQITAPADKVAEAVRFIDFQLALQNGINPQENPNLAEAVKEKVGEAYYNSFIDFQVMNYLLPFAITQEKLAIIGQPKVTSPNSKLTPGKELTFAAVATPKPLYDLDDFSPVHIQLPKVKVSEAEINQQLLMLAENYATYEKTEEHPVKGDDDLIFSIKTVDAKGEEVKNLTAERRAYTMGKTFLPKEFDDNILGMEVGQTKTFSVTTPDFKKDPEDENEDGTFTFEVTILELQQRVIPAITDEWVTKNIPGLKSVPELHEEIRKQGLAHHEQELSGMRSFAAASELAKRFKGSIPDEYYEMTRDDIVQGIQQNLASQNKTMQDFIKEQGGDQQFSMQLMMQTREVLTQGFSLDSLARHLKLEVTDADIAETFHLMAPGHEKEASMEFELTGRMYQVREAALRTKANNWLVENAEIEYVE